MNFQKRFISLFKTFVEKVFIPQCSKNQSVLSDWNKFNALISNENINFNEIQMYVDSIGNFNNQINPTLLQSQQQPTNTQKKQPYYPVHSSVYNRKKQQNLSFDNAQDINFNPNKTFGGQKTKLPMFQSKPQFQDVSRKPFGNGTANKQQLTKYRSTTPNMGTTNMGGMYKDTTVDNAPLMLASLEKLYKSLVDNQQKIQNLTQVTAQMNGQNLGSQSYY